MKRTTFSVVALVLAILLISLTASVPVAGSSLPQQAARVTTTVDPVGAVNSRWGVATLSGVITCLPEYAGSWMTLTTITLSQKVGRKTTITASASGPSAPCGTDPVPWTVQLTPANGGFAGGAALVTTKTTICIFEGGWMCSQYSYDASTIVQLRGGGG